MNSQQVRLISHIWHRYQSHSSHSRLLVAIAGAPGSGKTTLAAHLVHALNTLASHDSSLQNKSPAIAISMDGFHLTRAELDAMPNPSEAHRRRGAAFTFDVNAYATLIKRLREEPDAEVWAPSFDHAVKDPVEHSVRIGPEDRIVVVEGNYVALGVGEWGDVARLFDVTVFVDVDEEVAGRRLVRRHVAAGIVENEEAGWERVRANDLVNGREIKEHIISGESIDFWRIESVEDERWAHED